MPDMAGKTWPLAVRLEVLPGQGIVQKFDRAARYGFDAVELPGRWLPEYLDELLACKDRLALGVSSISLGFGGSLVSAEADARQQCRQDTKKLLDLCRELGGAGLVMPPVLHQDAHRRLANAGGHADVKATEDALLLEQLPELAEHAAGRDVLLLLEPVNRFETDYLNRLDQAASLCRRLDHPGLGITADFFHMQIEELNPPEALRQAGRWVRHVHVTENTRVEPGPGWLDFRPGFRALHEIGYQGHVVIECRTLSGPPDEVLPGSADYLRRIMAEVAA